MPTNVVAENVFGTMGTLNELYVGRFSSFHKSGKVMDLKVRSYGWAFMLTWGLSSIFLGAYAILQWLNIPLIVQAQLFGFLCFLCWGQCQYYGLKRSRFVSITVTVLLMAATGLLEYILVFTIKAQTRASGNTHGPTTVIGIIASVLLSVALLPQYWEIYKLKEVTGVSITFMLIDILGGVFNNLSLIFKEKFDVIASISYTLVIVLDSVIVILALTLNPIARRRRAAREVGSARTEE